MFFLNMGSSLWHSLRRSISEFWTALLSRLQLALLQSMKQFTSHCWLKYAQQWALKLSLALEVPSIHSFMPLPVHTPVRSVVSLFSSAHSHSGKIRLNAREIFGIFWTAVDLRTYMNKKSLSRTTSIHFDRIDTPYELHPSFSDLRSKTFSPPWHLYLKNVILVSTVISRPLC